MNQPKLSEGQRSFQPGPLAELEPESIFADEPRMRLNPAVELERLRPLLVDYDPMDELVTYYHPPRNYGVLIAKFLGYTFLAAVTIGIGISILGAFALTGC